MAKSKYETHVKDKLILVEAWARNGLTDEQIAKNLGISKDTFYKYKREYTDFSDSLKRGKEVVDIEVENALLKRALGYKYDEVTKERNEDTGELEITKVITKEVQPDTTAQIFWLKNRLSDKWKNDPHKVENDKKLTKLKEKEAAQREKLIEGTDI